MTRPTYADLVRELFPRLTGGIRWGLDRTEALLRAVGDPQRRFWSLHVGGTNGKGSVSAMLEAVLRAAGRRTGLYTSPHLCTFRERIRVAGEPLPEAALVAAAERLWPELAAHEPSFFEATTALAFLAFADAGVEAAVVEVGLGGRLDATNVVVPRVSVLTNVSLDHAEYLGDTLVSVAREKAGIIKPGVPVATAERGAEALAVFRERAAAVGAPLTVLDPAVPAEVRVDGAGTRLRLETEAWGELELHTPLVGAHQARNAALAVTALAQLPAALRPSREAVVRGIAEARLPGRLQRERLEGREWIFDAAHNPAAMEALAETVRRLAPARPLVALVGVLADKDWRRMLGPVRALADRVVLTVPPSAPAHRRWDPAAAAAELGGAAVEARPDFADALAGARAAAGEGTVLVTGSFHTVGDALCAVGLAPFGVDPPLPASAPGA